MFCFEVLDSKEEMEERDIKYFWKYIFTSVFLTENREVGYGCLTKGASIRLSDTF